MQKICESKKLNVFDYMPISFVVTFQNGVYIGLDKFIAYH